MVVITHAQPIAKIVPERQAKLLQVFISPSMLSRACRPSRLTVPPEIFRLMTNPRRSLSEAFVFSGVSGRSKTRNSSALRRFSRNSS